MNEFAERSEIKERLLEVIKYLKAFGRNPIQQIKSVPVWDWPTILLLLVSFSAVSGVLTGIVARSTMGIIGNLFFFPISSIVMSFLVSGFFFYAFNFLYRKTCNFLTLYTIVSLSALPLITLKILDPLGIPITVLGVLATCVLMAVGFIENFSLPKKGILKLLSLIFVIYFLAWMFSVITRTHEKESIKNNVTPESLDILQKELTGK